MSIKINLKILKKDKPEITHTQRRYGKPSYSTAGKRTKNWWIFLTTTTITDLLGENTEKWLRNWHTIQIKHYSKSNLWLLKWWNWSFSHQLFGSFSLEPSNYICKIGIKIELQNYFVSCNDVCESTHQGPCTDDH